MLVSVIIPCFNVEKYILQCIDSVLGQTYSDIEIICIENNSSDGTFQILTDLFSKYPEKITVLKEVKQGAPVARNRGLEVAKGKWIQFLDADDLILPHKIEHQLDIAESYKDLGFIASSYFRRILNGEDHETRLKLNDPFKGLFVTNLGITSANLFNSEKLKDIKGWNEKLDSSQEADLMFRLLKRNACVVFDEIPLTIIRDREFGQISQRNPKEKWLQYIALRLEIINFLKNEKTDYFSTEKVFYYNELFEQVKILAQYSIEAANKIYLKNIENGFVPELKNPLKAYNILLRLFGFKRTEQMKQTIKRLINKI